MSQRSNIVSAISIEIKNEPEIMRLSFERFHREISFLYDHKYIGFKVRKDIPEKYIRLMKRILKGDSADLDEHYSTLSSLVRKGFIKVILKRPIDEKRLQRKQLKEEIEKILSTPVTLEDFDKTSESYLCVRVKGVFVSVNTWGEADFFIRGHNYKIKLTAESNENILRLMRENWKSQLTYFNLKRYNVTSKIISGKFTTNDNW